MMSGWKTGERAEDYVTGTLHTLDKCFWADREGSVRKGNWGFHKVSHTQMIQYHSNPSLCPNQKS